MLTAKPTGCETLNLVRLALQMLKGGQQVPLKLADHFNEVLRLALALANDPANPPPALSKEAIDLALELQAHRELNALLAGAGTLSRVDGAIAGRVLAELDPVPVRA